MQKSFGVSIYRDEKHEHMPLFYGNLQEPESEWGEENGREAQTESEKVRCP